MGRIQQKRYLRHRAAILSVFSVCLVVLMAGCGGGGGGSAPASSRFAVPKFTDTGSGSWTVLVYMNADNDLEQFGIENFNQMEKIGSNSRMHIVVQFDRSPGYDTSNGNWSGCRRYLVTRDSDPTTIHSQLLQLMGNVDMGNPDTLKNFIAWGEQNYPATHYCLVIWGHASGWRLPSSTESIIRNVSFDDTSNSSIRTTDLGYALSGAPQPLDLVAFDACMMQMLEVSYEMKSSASYVVASEQSPPGDGYVYDQWLGPLASAPSIGPTELGQAICLSYAGSYVNSYDVTQSLVDLSKVRSVASAVDQFGTALKSLPASKASALATARLNSQHYVYDYYKDLQDYAAQASAAANDPAVTAAYAEVQSALSSAVVYESHTGSSVASSHGLSIYVPTPADYESRYTTLHFCQDYPHWAQFLAGQTQ